MGGIRQLIGLVEIGPGRIGFARNKLLPAAAIDLNALLLSLLLLLLLAWRRRYWRCSSRFGEQ